LAGPGSSWRVVITPNPKTSGNGKLSVLAAWGSVISRGGTDAQALEYLKQLYQHVPVLDTGARDATNTFTQEKLGDVHLTWENEAILEAAEYKGELESSTRRSASARSQAWRGLTPMWLAETPRPMPRPTWNFSTPTRHRRPSLGTATGQSIPEILKKHADRLPQIDLFPVTILAKDWDEAQQKFFADNGIFDHPFNQTSERWQGYGTR
jgi:sulfate/thiosulfate transport system substrate-binding protein